MESVDVAVIGAGVVGIAVARALALSGREVVVIERERQFGTGISSRNSEVIHAGIHYPPGSLKARLCVAGRDLLYAYCAERGVPHRRSGKLIVAPNEAERPMLKAIAANAAANGVDDLALLERGEVERIEPAIACAAALLSPSTGIVDSHALMLGMIGDAEAAGAMFAYGAAVERIERRPHDFAIRMEGDEGPALGASMVVNAAGLQAQAVARSIDGLEPRHIPPLHLAKGSYFALDGRSPFRRLVYPVPEPGGLGVHATIDLAGRTRFGPDVQWCDEPDYSVDPSRAERFYKAIRAYWPGLEDGTLRPDYCGIRPKLSGPGEPPADFVISGEEQHGVPGLINLFGIESPGLTAALAIGAEVAARLERNG